MISPIDFAIFLVEFAKLLSNNNVTMCSSQWKDICKLQREMMPNESVNGLHEHRVIPPSHFSSKIFSLFRKYFWTLVLILVQSLLQPHSNSPRLCFCELPYIRALMRAGSFAERFDFRCPSQIFFRPSVCLYHRLYRPTPNHKIISCVDNKKTQQGRQVSKFFSKIKLIIIPNNGTW